MDIKNIKISWGWVFAVAILIYVLWLQTCNKPRPADTSKQEVHTALVAEKKDNVAIDSLTSRNNKQANELISLRAEVDRLNKKLNIANSSVTNLANDVVDAKIKKDTGKYVMSCDSLADAAKNLAFFFQQLQEKMASERLTTDSILNRKDSIIDTQAASRARLTATINRLSSATQHNSLYIGLSGLGGSKVAGGALELEYVTKKGYTYSGGVFKIQGVAPVLFKVGAKKIISF